MSPNDAVFERALRSLAHPWSVAAIVVLAVNDHVLKHAVPSWWTGKLSDFAGLLFFPLLLTCLAGLLLELRHAFGKDGSRALVDPDAVARGAFALTAAWFAAVKTIEPARALTQDLVVALTGPGASIVLDPTDLVALVMLWPAWRLWRRSASFATTRPGSFTVRRSIGFASLCAAALATMATTYGPPVHVVRVAADVTGGPPILYAATADGRTYSSADLGRTWQSSEDQTLEGLPASTFEQPAGSVAAGEAVCVADAPETCYRIAQPGSFRVEASADGGQRWEADWQLPAGRLPFMRRLLVEGLDLGPPSFVPGPFDLVVASAGSDHVVLVAMGSEGGLVRDPDGAWRRVAIGPSAPTPDRATSLLQALLVMAPEYWIAISLALAAFAGMQLAAYRRRRWAWLMLISALLGVPGFAALGAGSGENYVLSATTVVPILAVMAVTALAIVVCTTMVLLAARRARLGSDEVAARRARATQTSVVTALAVAIALWCPYVAWAMGWVEEYRSAGWIGGLLALLVICVAWFGFGAVGAKDFAPPGDL